MSPSPCTPPPPKKAYPVSLQSTPKHIWTMWHSLSKTSVNTSIYQVLQTFWQKLALCTHWRHIGRGGTAWLNLNISTGWSGVTSFMPQLLCPWENSPTVLIKLEVQWAPELAWKPRRRENLLSMLGNKKCSLAIQHVACIYNIQTLPSSICTIQTLPLSLWSVYTLYRLCHPSCSLHIHYTNSAIQHTHYTDSAIQPVACIYAIQLCI
jgi:hypothetical protein